jgi:hypothetical protein
MMPRLRLRRPWVISLKAQALWIYSGISLPQVLILKVRLAQNLLCPLWKENLNFTLEAIARLSQKTSCSGHTRTRRKCAAFFRRIIEKSGKKALQTEISFTGKF